MKFEEIFKEEGLYKADSFRKGTAFKIKKNSITDSMELYMVSYEKATDITPQHEEPMLVYGGLFEKEYVKLFNRNELFKEYNELV